MSPVTSTDTWLTIGKITGVHGLAGNLKVWSFAESPETFEKGRKVMLRREGDITTPQGGLYTITQTAPRKKGLMLALEGVGTREAAENLVGQEILMHRDELPELEEDTWYWDDLVGLKVTDRDLGLLGTVERLFSTGAHDILVVTSKPDAREVMIPMVSHFVEAVDLEAGEMTTVLPEGFIPD